MQPDLQKKISRGTNVRVQDLQDLFEWLDHDKGGTITIDEFLMGFKWVNEPLRAKTLVKLQERVAGDLKKLEDKVQQRVQEKFIALEKIICQPLRKVHAIAE